ncbi:MAG: Lrp/AsnC ligand binding domain-containing protein, partial [Planctomycetales bacterium]|nr:Lrp/AsnC ligand binding domain-containing protein [Planctomycetales bacterium]
ALTSFISIQTTENIGLTRIGDRIAELPGVQEVHFITGEFCYLLKVHVKDTNGLTKLMEKIGKIPGVASSRTSLVLKPIKESLELDIESL